MSTSNSNVFIKSIKVFVCPVTAKWTILCSKLVVSRGLMPFDPLQPIKKNMNKIINSNSFHELPFLLSLSRLSPLKDYLWDLPFVRQPGAPFWPVFTFPSGNLPLSFWENYGNEMQILQNCSFPIIPHKPIWIVNQGCGRFLLILQ